MVRPNTPSEDFVASLQREEGQREIEEMIVKLRVLRVQHTEAISEIDYFLEALKAARKVP